MWMRVFRSQERTAETLREAFDAYREKDLPRIEQAPGFLGLVLGEDAARGSVLSVGFWEDEDAMMRAERLSTEARHRALPRLDDTEPIVVDHYEVTYASHLDDADGWSPYVLAVRFAGLNFRSLKVALESCRQDAERHEPDIGGVEGVVLAANRMRDGLAMVSFWPSEQEMRTAEDLAQDVSGRAAEAAHARRRPEIDCLQIHVSSSVRRIGEAAPSAS